MDNKNQAFKKHQKKVKFEVDSKYSIIETIGEGAYGVVCSAVDTSTGQRVAIKKICGVFDVLSITKRTLREIKILKHFKHDNVISIKEILRPPVNLNDFSDVYVVLDLMGSDLHHIIHSKQDLSEEHIRYFLYQLMRGLKYIHSANIIHRDLKPSNLLINKDCELKIGDFGMARSLSASLSEKTRVMTEYVATRWYRAPELMLSLHQFTESIDVWSVGCIFAEMLGREALFPGSNYLNQLQLILSVVGVPSVEFMATITSKRVQSYIGRLPHKSPVSFSTLYPNASPASISLLSQLLILDPGKRIRVEDALETPFLEKYHDIDDEPTCRKFDYDIEGIPFERQILRDHIIQEIQYYHSKRAKPNLAPIITDLVKPFKFSSATPTAPFTDSSQGGNVTGNPEQKSDSRKRKQKNQLQTQGSKNKISPTHGGKKKVLTPEPKAAKAELSSQDKELLQRWSNMQKDTKPFIHPIRKHMDELLQLKAESIVPQGETVKGQVIVDRVSTSKTVVPLQFTNFVPQQKNGGVSLVAEQTVRMTPNVVVNSSTSSTLSTLTVTPSSSRNTAVVPANKVPGQTILVPVGNLPMYQLRGAFSGAGPFVIIPNLAAPKVTAPIPIAPKPVQMSGINLQSYQLRANSNSLPVIPLTSSHIIPHANVTTSVRTIVNLTQSDSSNFKTALIDKNVYTKASGSNIVIKLQKPQPVVKNEVITIPDSATGSGGIPSSKIHFKVSPQVRNQKSSNSTLSFASDDNSKKSGESSSDGLLSSRVMFSSDSILSELTISSAELDSSPSSPQIPLPQVSPEESAQVIAAVKKLDEEDKKIVHMIEELEESSEHSGTTEYPSAKSTNSTVDEMPIDTKPCTTLPSSHTDNWSIVKNMLVSNIRAKQLKKFQHGQEDLYTSERVALTQGLITSVLSTSITDSMPLMQQNPVQYIANTSRTIQNQYSTNVISNIPPHNIPQAHKNQYSTNVMPNLPPLNIPQTHKNQYSTNVIPNLPPLNIPQTHKNQYSTNVISDIPTHNIPQTCQNQYSINSISNTPALNITNTPALNITNTPVINISNYDSSTIATLPSKNTSNFDVLYTTTAVNNSSTTTTSTSTTTTTLSRLTLLVDSIMTSKDSMRMLKDTPSIKIEDTMTGDIACIKNENVVDKVSIKVENYVFDNKRTMKMETITLPGQLQDSGSDIEMKDIKEEGKEMLLSNCCESGKITPLLTCSISDLDDAFLTTFVNTPKTPKSGAAGYGLGMDFEDLFAGSSIDLLNPVRLSACQSDSVPPLSASLLTDWLGNNDIDPADFADLQRELESTSYSLLDSG